MGKGLNMSYFHMHNISENVAIVRLWLGHRIVGLAGGAEVEVFSLQSLRRCYICLYSPLPYC